jgi:hypothetical protein
MPPGSCRRRQGRIFKSPGAPKRQWMWGKRPLAATVNRAAQGYEPTREAAMVAFAKSWQNCRYGYT